ncbi:MAG: KdsC family phosphatase [Chitinophagaceae bacterium]|jgi:3-deoxy-D-manno-octulosonate 8-phosphate phosphatase (KDO 8-P phosphatase)
MNLLEQFQKIKAFVFDMDGVLTDGSLIIQSGQEFIRTMNIKDGYALQHAVKKGYHVVIISGSVSKPCAERFEYLGIRNVYMKVKDKEEVLAQFILANNLKWDEVLFMGDDIPDLEVMKQVGLPCCPNDAVQEIKAVSKFISTQSGGKGCVREVIEKVLKLNDDWVVRATETSAI